MSEDKKTDYTALTGQWEKELMENPAVQKYCKPYKAYCLESFCKAYAKTKAFGLQYGEMYQKRNEDKQYQWTDAGYRHLGIIQQKKLFDAQCLWRADQLKIKEIEICFDFKVWEADVLNCPFIDPVTEQEIDWYCEYLSQNNVDIKQGYMDGWQDYGEIKEANETDNGNRNFPEWYEFHNGKTGNGILLILPDIRGEREEYYRNLAREKYQKENPPAETARDPEMDKPSMDYFRTNLHIEVAKQIEDNRTVTLMQEYLNGTEYLHTFEYEDAEANFRFLAAIKDELIPIEAHYDYREALRRAVDSYQCRKIAEHLYYTFQKYERMLKLGFGFGTEKEKEQFKFYSELGEKWKESVLRGREANGEPRDFNF